MRIRQSANQKRVLSRIQLYWHPHLSLVASRTVRNKFVLLANHPVYSTLLQQPDWTKIAVENNGYFLEG